MKRVIFLSIALFFSAVSFAQTLHTIIFANTFDSSIGESCLQDYEHMEIEFNAIAMALRMDLEMHHHQDYDFTKEKLVEVINSLKCKPDDVVWFYFTGHGGRTEQTQGKFPLLALGLKEAIVPVSLLEIDRAIANKNPRLRIVMADACNSFVDRSIKGSEGGNTVIKDINTDNYAKLLKQTKGSIIASSSSVGEVSSAFQGGGGFTISFLDALQKTVVGSQNVSWTSIFENAKIQTTKLAGHTPQFDISIQNINPQVLSPAPTVNPTVINVANPINYMTDLLAVASDTKSNIDRIRLVNPILQKHFEGNEVPITVVGKNGTILEIETAENFMKRLSVARKLIQLVEVGCKKNAKGKITELKVHEIYKF